MAARKVFGTIHDSRDQPWANQRVTFVLRVGSFTSATQYPRKRVEATTNSVGYFEVDLWANSDGLLPTTYQCKLPDADEFEFRLSNGVAPINLSELRGLGGISTQVPQTLLEQLQPYFLSQSQGDGRYRKLTDTIAFSDLAGAAVDSQIPISIARIDDVIARIAQHAAASDPHPQYLTPAEGAALFAPAGSPSATNLTLTARTATTLTVSSDTGEDATIPGASTTLSGVMSAADKTKLDGITAGAQPNAVISVAGKTGVITLVKADVGLGLADNTADADKPISTATATALAARELTAARTLTPTPTDPGNTATINVFLSWLISAMRGAQTSLGGLGALATKSTIADIDVVSGAAIAWSKISKSGATAADVGAQPANAKLTTIAALTGTTPIRSDGSNGTLTAAEIPNLDASKTTTGTFLDSQIPASIARDAEVTAAIAAHVGLADPHPTYLTAAEGNAAYAPLGATGTTNLTIANRTATTIDIASDTGTDATIPAATTALSGMMSAADKSKLDGVAAGAQVNTVASVAGKTGVVTLVKADVGLGLADNTADADKPISTATATALAARELTAARTLTPTATDPGNTATINGFLSWLISAMRSAQTTLSGLGTLATKSTIVSADITDGTITNADISATAAIVASKLSGVQPLSSRLTGFDGLAGPGLVQLPSGAGTSPTISTPAEIRSAAGLSRLVGNDGGIIKTGAGAPYTSPYTLSVQRSDGSTYIEILNSYGAGGGAFFGLEGAGAAGDTFALYSYQGGPLRIYTGSTVASANWSWVFSDSGQTTFPGHISINGLITPKWYSGLAGLPTPASVGYASVGAVYDGAAAPNTFLAISDGSSWLKMLTLDSAGVARVPTIVVDRVQYAAVSAAAQPNLSSFVDSATGKLSFKDATGTVNALY
jgi:hypothetical protein